jgi:hypothetical protein
MLDALFTRSPDLPPLPRPPVPPDTMEPPEIEISFGEFLRALNPLHHLPVIGTIYRAATGETIPPVLRVLGGGVFGGPVGMLSAAVMAALDEFRAAAPQAPPPGERPRDVA